MNLRFEQETSVLLSSWSPAVGRHLSSHCLSCKMGVKASDPFIHRDVENMRTVIQ